MNPGPDDGGPNREGRPDGAILVSTMGSERATGGRGEKIVSRGDRIHLVWQDVSRDGYLNRIRTRRTDSETWDDPVTLNVGIDNHARPVITVDSVGYLHTIMSGHGTPISYRRSTRPDDASEWEPEQQAGAGTYPILICGPTDDLFFTVRAADGDGIDLYRKRSADPSFHRAAKLVCRTERFSRGYAAYPNSIAFDRSGMLHFAAGFYEGTGRTDHRGIHQAVCSMRSRDSGLTGESRSTPVELPAGPADMDVLHRSEEPRHEPMPPPEVVLGPILPGTDGSIVIPCISHRDRPGELLLHRGEAGGAWSTQRIDTVDDQFPDERPVALAGGVRSDGSFYLLLTLAPLSRGWRDGKPLRDANPEDLPDLRAVWVSGRPGAHRVIPAIEPGVRFNSPTVEQCVGANPIPPGRLPAFAYFDGTSQYPRGLLEYFADVEGYLREGELIRNRVFLVDSRPSGKVQPTTGG